MAISSQQNNFFQKFVISFAKPKAKEFPYL